MVGHPITMENLTSTSYKDHQNSFISIISLVKRSHPLASHFHNAFKGKGCCKNGFQVATLHFLATTLRFHSKGYKSCFKGFSTTIQVFISSLQVS